MLTMSTKYPDLFSKALEYLDTGNYDEAITQLKNIISKDDNQSDAWYNLGLAYYRKADYENSIRSYEKATNIDNEYSDAWYNLGITYRDRAGANNNNENDLKNALKYFDMALAIDKNPNFFGNKGLVEEKLGLKENAIQSYEESTKIFPQDALSWSYKGYLLYNMRRYGEAKSSFEKVIELEPNNDYAWYYLGLTCYKLSDSKNAYKSFMQALRLNPRNEDTYEQIGISFESLGMSREAKYYYKLFRNIKGEILDFDITGGPQDLVVDLWTSVDELGYDIYANTIAKLLVSLKETPVAISIQAPWGAGKTSLMRIIQEKIDVDGKDAYKAKIRADLRYEKLKDLKKLLKGIIKSSKKDSIKDNHDTSHEEQIITVEKKTDNNEQKKYISVWFDPWEYENTEQLWAGLADSIVRGIINRMSPGRKDLFLLQLNLGIYDFSGLLNWMRSHIISQTWKKFRPWLFVTVGGLIASVLSIAAGMISTHPHLYGAGIAGIALTLLQSGVNFFRNNDEMENLAASFSLDEYLKVPDYSAELGKTHEAMEDIRRIIRSIPDEYKPLIIFVDDLDRCFPNSIAKLFEGVNQFISSNFKDCIFILGMDNQVVASALDVIYNDIIEKLPEYLLQSQLGWSYLEKFIQLPILIPPTNQVKFRKYIQSLISGKGPVRTVEDAHKNNRIPFESNTFRNINDTSNHDADAERLAYAAYIFSNNPRNVKRFINLVTYYSNLRNEIERIVPDAELPTYDQIRRWIILILKWPSLAQWLYWSQDPLSYSISSDALTSPSFRLKQLETLALDSKSQDDWVDKISKQFGFESHKNIPWIADHNVREFFIDEKNQKVAFKISDGAGLGIY